MKGCPARGRCLVLRDFAERQIGLRSRFCREAERSEEREWEMEVSSRGGDAVSAEEG